MRILAISGSLQKQSGNLSLLRAAAAAPPTGVEIVISDALRGLPLFDPDLEQAGVPPEVQTWRQEVYGSDALLLACPEYGFSLPGALKNGVDWLIGSGELERKVVGVAAATSHPERGKRGLRALSDTLRAVSARIVGGRPIVRGPGFESEVAALVRAVAAEASLDEEEPAHGMGLNIRPSALVTAWWTAFNRSDIEALTSFYARDAVVHRVGASPSEGRGRIRQMLADSFAAATMVRILESFFEDGEWVILEWRDPKGLRGCAFFHVQRGQIILERSYRVGETAV